MNQGNVALRIQARLGCSTVHIKSISIVSTHSYRYVATQLDISRIILIATVAAIVVVPILDTVYRNTMSPVSMSFNLNIICNNLALSCGINTMSPLTLGDNRMQITWTAEQMHFSLTISSTIIERQAKGSATLRLCAGKSSVACISSTRAMCGYDRTAIKSDYMFAIIVVRGY